MKCIDCSLIGCPLRKEAYRGWSSQDLHYNLLIQADDKDLDNRCNCKDCVERRRLIDMCPEHTKSENKKFEYLCEVEYHYDCLPRDIRKKTLSVIAVDESDAVTKLKKMYPNPRILSTKLQGRSE